MSVFVSNSGQFFLKNSRIYFRFGYCNSILTAIVMILIDISSIYFATFGEHLFEFYPDFVFLRL